MLEHTNGSKRAKNDAMKFFSPACVKLRFETLASAGIERIRCNRFVSAAPKKPLQEDCGTKFCADGPFESTETVAHSLKVSERGGRASKIWRKRDYKPSFSRSSWLTVCGLAFPPDDFIT
jgi:hypothetical protein